MCEKAPGGAKLAKATVQHDEAYFSNLEESDIDTYRRRRPTKKKKRVVVNSEDDTDNPSEEDDKVRERKIQNHEIS